MSSISMYVLLITLAQQCVITYLDLILLFDYNVDLTILPLALMLLYNGKYIISNPDGTKWATLSRSIKLSRLTTTTEKLNLYT